MDDLLRFSKEDISHLLEAKMHEKRGMSKSEYIDHCRKLWDAQPDYDPTWQQKKIIDYLLPPQAEDVLIIDGYQLDYITAKVRKQINEVIKSRKHIECIISGSAIKKDETIRQVIEKRRFGHSLFLDIDAPPQSEKYFVGRFRLIEYHRLKKSMSIDSIRATCMKLLTLVHEIKFQSSEFASQGSGTDNLAVPISSYSNNTLCLWQKADPRYLSSFLFQCSHLLTESLKMGFALYGSITYGEALVDMRTDTYEGVSLNEAEELLYRQEWVGATLGTSFIINDGLLETEPSYLLPNIDEKLIIPLFFQHLSHLHPFSSPYLTLDFITHWKRNSTIEELLQVLKKLKSNTTKKYKAYYQNTIDYISYLEECDRKFRYYFLRCEFNQFDPGSNADVGFTRMNTIETLTKVPCILKLISGRFLSGHLIYIPEEISNHNKEVNKILKSSLFFIDLMQSDKIDPFLEALKNENVADCLQKFPVQILKGTSIAALGYYRYMAEKYGELDDEL